MNVKGNKGPGVLTKRIREFFPSDTGNEEVEEIVIRLLREWKEKQEGGKSE